MHWSSMTSKCLLSVFIFITLSAKGQGGLISDSWAHAGKWWTHEAYESEDWWYVGLGVSALGLTIAFDQELQSGLSFPNPELQKELSPYMEPWGNPVYMGGAAMIAYFGAEMTNQDEMANVSSLALQSMLSSGLVALSLKFLFHRVRPEEQLRLDPYQFKGPSLSRDNLSFPSGHSSIAFSLAASISAYYQDIYYVAIPLYTLAGLTAWQRIYAQKHWPSDVVMGAIIGTFIGRKLAHWQRSKSRPLSLRPGFNRGQALGLKLQWTLDPIKP